MIKQKIIYVTIILLIAFVAIIFFANWRINSSTDGSVYDNIESIPYNKVGLLLGTSKHLGDGSANQYFLNRIKSAVELYNAGKISYIVISGDNRRSSYNEPVDMRKELINGGVPKEKIFLDYAGFRTYDSVVRLDKIFGQKNFTVIS